MNNDVCNLMCLYVQGDSNLLRFKGSLSIIICIAIYAHYHMK